MNQVSNYIYDVAIIGAGPVGLFGIFEAGMLGMKCVVIDSLSSVGGQCSALYPQKPIYDIPAYPKIYAQELIENLLQQSAPFKPEFVLSVRVELIYQIDKIHYLKLSNGQLIQAKSIIVAAGNGIFAPNKLPIDNAVEFENKTLFYHITEKSLFTGKRVAIAGGGDAALDWVIELASIAKKVFLIHRRNNFRAATSTLEKMKSLQNESRVDLITPYQLNKLLGYDGVLNSVEVSLDQQTKKIEIDYLLPFFGLQTNLEHITNWKLKISNDLITVNPATMQTNIEGVFAIGDIANYSGKIKLILSGFAEAARACHSIRHHIYPDEHMNFQYSTVQGVPQ